MRKLEPEAIELTNITHLQLGNVILLYKVDYLPSEKCDAKSEFRVFECVIWQLLTNLRHETPAPTATYPTPGSPGIDGSSKPTPGVFVFHSFSEPTAGHSGSQTLSVQWFNLPTVWEQMKLGRCQCLPFWHETTLEECNPSHWTGQHNRLRWARSATAERRRRNLGHAPDPDEYAHWIVYYSITVEC